MEETKTKTVKLSAYVIDNDDMGKKHSDLYDNLVEKLSQNQNADARRMKLNEKSTEEDLLSDFALNATNVYGVIWRIAPTKEMPHIPADFFKNAKISRDALNDKDKEEETGVSCKSIHYFVMNKKYLVTDYPKSRVKSLQVYLNWLLEPYKTSDVIYSFTPKVKSSESTPLREIRSIVIGENTTVKVSQKQENDKQDDKSATMKVLQIAQDKLMSMIAEDKYLKDIVDKNIVQAQLVLKIRKPNKKEEADFENILGSTMKPIGDTDGITFKLKNGKTIKGSTILVTKDVEIELTEDGLISEKALMLEMLDFLKRL